MEGGPPPLASVWVCLFFVVFLCVFVCLFCGFGGCFVVVVFCGGFCILFCFFFFLLFVFFLTYSASTHSVPRIRQRKKKTYFVIYVAKFKHPAPLDPP